MSESKKEMLQYFEETDLESLSLEIQEQVQRAQGLFIELGRLMKSITLYGSQHQSSLNFRTRFFDHLTQCLEVDSPLEVEIQTYALIIEDQVIYEDERTEGNFIYRFYMDRIRSLSFLQGITAKEVDQLLDLFLLDWSAPELFEDDAVTLLWEAGVDHVQYTVAQVYNEETHEIEDRDEQGSQTLNHYLNHFQTVIETDPSQASMPHIPLSLSSNLKELHLLDLSFPHLNIESALSQREMVEKLLYIAHQSYRSQATSLRENERLVSIFDRMVHLFAQSNQMSDLERCLRCIFSMVHPDLKHRLIDQWAVPTLIKPLMLSLAEHDSKEAFSALSCLYLLHPQSMGPSLNHLEKVHESWFPSVKTLITSSLSHMMIDYYRCLKSCTYLQGKRLIESTFETLNAEDLMKAFKLAWSHSDQGIRYESLMNLPLSLLQSPSYSSSVASLIFEGIHDSYSKIRTRSLELLGQVSSNSMLRDKLKTFLLAKKKWDLKDLQNLYCTSALCGVDYSFFLSVYQSDRLSLGKPKNEKLCALLALAIHSDVQISTQDTPSSSHQKHEYSYQSTLSLLHQIVKKRNHNSLKEYAQWGITYLQGSSQVRKNLRYELYYRGSLGHRLLSEGH